MRHMPTLKVYLHEMHAREEQINHKRPHMGGRFVEVCVAKYEF
jgi:hypothetical protein